MKMFSLLLKNLGTLPFKVMLYRIKMILLFGLQRCIVLDIEGTTTPISFVTEVLFPYARGNVGKHLSATYDTAETQDDIKLLRSQVRILFKRFDLIMVLWNIMPICVRFRYFTGVLVTSKY